MSNGQKKGTVFFIPIAVTLKVTIHLGVNLQVVHSTIINLTLLSITSVGVLRVTRSYLCARKPADSELQLRIE